MLVWMSGAPPCKGGQNTDRRTDHLEPGPDSHLLCYCIPDRASHITSGGKRKPLEAILVALSRDRLACGCRGLSYVSPGTRLPSELDLLVGGRDRWTG